MDHSVSSSKPSKISQPQRRCVLVCQHRSCQRNGSAAVLAAFRQAEKPQGVVVSESDCMGQCGSGPTVRVIPDNTWYCRVKPEDVSQIVQAHLNQGKPVEALLHPRFHPRFDLDWSANPNQP